MYNRLHLQQGKVDERGQWVGPQARHEEEAWQGHVDDE